MTTETLPHTSKLLDTAHRVATHTDAALQFITTHRAVLEGADTSNLQIWHWCIPDLYLTTEREDLKDLLALGRGKPWEKTVTLEGARYSQTVEGVNVIIRTGLPPTCEIVYDDIAVEAVPAHTRKVARVVCDESTSPTE